MNNANLNKLKKEKKRFYFIITIEVVEFIAIYLDIVLGKLRIALLNDEKYFVIIYLHN